MILAFAIDIFIHLGVLTLIGLAIFTVVSRSAFAVVLAVVLLLSRAGWPSLRITESQISSGTGA